MLGREIGSRTRFPRFESAIFLGDRRFEKSVIEVRDEPVLAARTLFGTAGHRIGSMKEDFSEFPNRRRPGQAQAT
jgi:hypothetical protein